MVAYMVVPTRMEATTVCAPLGNTVMVKRTGRVVLIQDGPFLLVSIYSIHFRISLHEKPSSLIDIVHVMCTHFLITNYVN